MPKSRLGVLRRTAASIEDSVHSGPPGRNGGLGIGVLTTNKKQGLIGSVSSILPDHIVDGIDVPDHNRAGLEIVGSLGGDFGFAASPRSFSLRTSTAKVGGPSMNRIRSFGSAPRKYATSGANDCRPEDSSATANPTLSGRATLDRSPPHGRQDCEKPRRQPDQDGTPWA